MKRLVVGCGYLGHRVARRWRDAGDAVYTVTRSSQRGQQLRSEGFAPIVADIMNAATVSDLPRVDAVLFAVGFDRTAGVSIQDVYVGGLRNVLNGLPESSGPVVYISSTGVYAQNDGGWVDERSACEPVRDGGKACLAAERLLADHPRGRTATLLRLAGIYGPGRIPRAADMVAGKPLPPPADGYLNLIHVEDAVGIVLAAAERRGVTRCYTVSDGNPTTRQDYFDELARQLNASPPSFEGRDGDGSDESKSRRQRGTSSKRVRSERMLQELGVCLEYPSYREGLAAIISASES